MYLKSPNSSSNYEINEALLDLKQYLQHTYQDNFEQLVLFGSRARGDYKPDSDIDVLIVLKNLVDYSQEIEKTSFFIAELCLDNDVVISRAFTTSEQLSSKKSPFFRNIQREGVII